jgi:hypothetical protein
MKQQRCSEVKIYRLPSYCTPPALTFSRSRRLLIQTALAHTPSCILLLLRWAPSTVPRCQQFRDLRGEPTDTVAEFTIRVHCLWRKNALSTQSSACVYPKQLQKGSSEEDLWKQILMQPVCQVLYGLEKQYSIPKIFSVSTTRPLIAHCEVP